MSNPSHPLFKRTAEDRFTCSLAALPSYLDDHVVLGEPVLPAANMLEMFTWVLRQESGSAHVGLKDFAIRKPVQLRPKAEGGSMVVSITRRGESFDLRFRVSHGDVEEELAVARGIVAEPTAAPKLDAIAPASSLSVDEFYESLRQAGITYGPHFRAIESLEVGDGFAHSKLRIPASVLAAENMDGYAVHPVLLDAALQTTLAAIPRDPRSYVNRRAYIPLAVDNWYLATFKNVVGASCTAQVRSVDPTGASATLDCVLHADNGSCLASISGLRVAVSKPSAISVSEPSQPAPVAATPQVLIVDELVSASPDERRRVLLEYVRTLVVTFLKRPDAEVDPSSAFRDLGMTSMDLVDLGMKLGETFPTSLTATLAFEYPTPQELADHLVSLVPSSS